MQVPAIDIEPFRDGDAADRAEVARQIARAFETIGFVTVTGHGVPAASTDAMFASSRRFFDQPAAAKQAFAPAENGGPGYLALAQGSLAATLGEAAPPDLKETFTIGPVDVPDEAYYRQAAARRWYQPNPWPPLDGFTAIWEAHYRSVTRFALTMMEICAVALELPDRYFDPWFDRHTSILSVINYPEQPTPPEPGQLRAGAHSDYGSLTLLFKEAGGSGLQVRAADGSWVDVLPAPDAFVVNIGDMLAEWTNDRWVSTVHRVANPTEGGAASRRMSCGYFLAPSFDAMISPLPGCVDDEHPALYEPISAADHLLSKMAKQFA
ncbi:MAG TPA: 2-oxoglutarate and iron-dependent oxygenase domain-containing protein [Gaiellales bacterium]|jgi:isopenicillin N synthase-like dioxygenase